MMDARLRRRLEGPLDRAAHGIDVGWLSPDRLTAAGLLLGLSSAAAAAAAWWLPALALWLLSRACDGLDGPLARRRERAATARGETTSPAGAYFDITADFVVYASIAERSGRQVDDARALRLRGGLAEGAETIAVHSLWLIWPGSSGAIAAVWAAVVGVSAAHRIVMGRAALR